MSQLDRNRNNNNNNNNNNKLFASDHIRNKCKSKSTNELGIKPTLYPLDWVQSSMPETHDHGAVHPNNIL